MSTKYSKVSMYPKNDERNIERASPSSIRILVADADAAKIDRVKSCLERNLQTSIQVCKHYFDLVPTIESQLPDLLLLGILDRFNSLDTCQECHQIWEHLPIVLLSRQNSVDDYFQQFRRLALTRGATEVVTNDLLQLEPLIRGLSLPRLSSIDPFADRPSGEVAVETMLMAIQEISEIGSNYFGPLAQGNYWRKSHDRLLADFPTLQNWSADHFGAIDCIETMRRSQCTVEDVRGLQHWVSAYISECERIIGDFSEILKNSKLSRSTREFLTSVVISRSNLGNAK